jgi:competence protein ComEC
VYILLAVFLLSKNRKPGVLVCCGLLGLCLALLCSWLEPAGDNVRFTVLDVGQGQCLLFQSEGRTYMVDCGGTDPEETADIAAQTLLSQGISQLDGLIVTHFDSDHSGAVSNLLSRIRVDLMILPPVAHDLATDSNRTVYASEDLTITFGEARIRIFASQFSGNSNENSLCILFDTDECDILVTGDRGNLGEMLLLRDASIPDVDVLVAGHHGSRDSTGAQLLEAARPEIVCISVGEGNPYGHPSPEVLQRLDRYQCAVYRTDLHGDIVIRR